MLFIVVLYLLGLYLTLWLAAGTVVFAVMELNYAASGALGEVLLPVSLQTVPRALSFSVDFSALVVQ
ncbi:hypothetical protein [Yoonia sp. R2-816]|uniref:hypothetical protein n=1 Tax=Yoonia sp. R2-816 TaxID=3342638 RepID=UPI0037274468